MTKDQEILYKFSEVLPHVGVAVKAGGDEKQLNEMIEDTTVCSHLSLALTSLGSDLYYSLEYFYSTEGIFSSCVWTTL